MPNAKKAPDTKHLEHLTAQHEIPEIAHQFGVHPNTVRTWLRDPATCPYWTIAAARGIQARDSDLRVLTAVLPGEMRCTASNVLRALGASGITFTSL